jgi:LysM domain
LSTRRLKGHVGILVAGVALAALAILAGLLGTAEAQEEEKAQEYTGTATSVKAEQNTTTTTTTTTDDEKGASAAWQPAPEPSTTRLVVEPGDSLWSISEEHIGPGVTPEQIAYEVERIFELNRDQIGQDPNLIFPGQEFFLVLAAPGGGAAAMPEEPAVFEGRPAAANEESLSAAEQQQAPKPTVMVVESEGVSDTPASEEAVSEKAVVPEDGVSEGAIPAPQTPDQTDEQAESAPAESTPAESAPATTAGSIVSSVLEAYNSLKGERHLLGVGILALTLIVAILMAWRLPMRRNVEDSQAWGIPQQQYDENYAPAEAPLEASPEVARGPEGEPGSSASSSASGPPPEEVPREPSVSSSPAARGAEEDVLAQGDAVAASTPDQERLRRVRQLRRIRQRNSPRRTS